MSKAKETRARNACDGAIHKMAKSQVDHGCGMDVLLDRLMTYATAQSVTLIGSKETAAIYREFATKIEGGLFETLEPGHTRGTQH